MFCDVLCADLVLVLTISGGCLGVLVILVVTMYIICKKKKLKDDNVRRKRQAWDDESDFTDELLSFDGLGSNDVQKFDNAAF